MCFSLRAEDQPPSFQCDGLVLVLLAITVHAGIAPHSNRCARSQSIVSRRVQDRLDQRGSKVKALVAHPGVSASSLQATSTATDNKSWLHNTGLGLIMRFSQSEEDGAMPLLKCICGKEVPARAFIVPSEKGLVGIITNDFWTGLPQQIRPEKLCTDPKNKALLWEASEKACGAFFP